MDPTDLITHLEHIRYLEVFELLLKWAVPLFIILIVKNIIGAYAAYVMVRSDKYIAVGRWVTVRGFKGRIVKLGPFSVVIENENREGYKIPIKDFNHIIFHPVHCDPTKFMNIEREK